MHGPRKSGYLGNGGRHPRPFHGNSGGGGNTAFDSNGPTGKMRGSAQQLVEKYMNLGRDSLSSGDFVTAESCFQYAEHYRRLSSTSREERQSSSSTPSSSPNAASASDPSLSQETVPPTHSQDETPQQGPRNYRSSPPRRPTQRPHTSDTPPDSSEQPHAPSTQRPVERATERASSVTPESSHASIQGQSKAHDDLPGFLSNPAVPPAPVKRPTTPRRKPSKEEPDEEATPTVRRRSPRTPQEPSES